MKNVTFKLLKKELILCVHPLAFIMLAGACMLMIPNYPYSVGCFYLTLGLFFTCLQGRENNDVIYSINLPIAKKDIVKSRMLVCIILELIQILVMVPFIFIKKSTMSLPNQAGMDANVSMLGMAFLVFAVFNVIFFGKYYKDVYKVGSSFVIATTAVFVLIFIEIACTYAIPFVRNRLDSMNAEYLPDRMIFMLICMVVYAVVTLLTYRSAIKNFMKQDL